MNQQQKIEIGLRIKELRNNSAETNRSIAETCDVSVEAVRNWIAGKGIAYDNAQKVADIFKVDVDWIWRGQEKEPTKPDDFDPFERIEAELQQQRQAITDLTELVKDLRRPTGRGKKAPGATPLRDSGEGEQ